MKDHEEQIVYVGKAKNQNEFDNISTLRATSDVLLFRLIHVDIETISKN